MIPKLILPNDEIVAVTPANGKAFTIEEIYALLNCDMVEYLTPPGSHGAIMLVDEEGKLKGRERNRVASAIWQEGCTVPAGLTMPDHATSGKLSLNSVILGQLLVNHRAADFIVGPALLCHVSQFD